MQNTVRHLQRNAQQRTAASYQRHLQQLFSAEELGDWKPTQLLRHLQQLAGDTPRVDGAFLRELFLQFLSSNIRTVLASTQSDMPINKLAQLADKIVDVAIPEVANVSGQQSSSELESLCAEISLKQQITSLKKASCRIRSPYCHCLTSPAPPLIHLTKFAFW